MSSNLIRRVAVAAVGIPAAVAVIYLGGWVLAAVVGVLGAVGVVELFRLARAIGARGFVPVGVAGALAVPLGVYAMLGPAVPWAGAALLYGAVTAVMLTIVMAMARGPTAKPAAAVGVTLLGLAYPVGMLSFLVVLRHAPGAESPWAATWLVLFPLVLTWVGDTMAMGGGALFGGPKLSPILSPKKTWAGSLVATSSALLLAPAYGVFVLARFSIVFPVWQLMVFGLVVSVVGQLGDLGESLFKREAGVKDSGRFFSGHGGVLDRLDALYWALPAAALMYHVMGVW